MSQTSEVLTFDEETSRGIETVYATPDVIEQRARVLDALRVRPGEDVLDVGTGPGFLAHDIAAAIGPSGSVTATDISPSMIELARRRVPLGGAAPVHLDTGDATALPFEDRRFDAVVSTQVYEYVADMDRALAEARRVLRPDGRLLVLDTDWDSIVWRSPNDDLSRRVLTAWDDHLVHRDLPRHLPQLLRRAGFALERSEIVPLLNIGYRRETYSGLALEFMAAYAIGRQGLTDDDTRTWADGLRALGEDYFFSLNRYLFLARRLDD